MVSSSLCIKEKSTPGNCCFVSVKLRLASHRDQPSKQQACAILQQVENQKNNVMGVEDRGARSYRACTALFGPEGSITLVTPQCDAV